jgi:MFS family permease
MVTEAHNEITVDELTEGLGFGCFQIGLLFIVSVIWLADAMEMILISFISPPLQCYFGLTDAEKALITSVVFVGMFIGGGVWGLFQDRFGRKVPLGHQVCRLLQAATVCPLWRRGRRQCRLECRVFMLPVVVVALSVLF